tara:strand:+ start:399 stop:644 length:246 start_codon:yes stop_codon:yes gene_type:complete
MDLMIAFLMYLQVLFPQDSGQYTDVEVDQMIQDNIQSIEAIEMNNEVREEALDTFLDEAQEFEMKAFEEWEPPIETEPIWD